MPLERVLAWYSAEGLIVKDLPLIICSQVFSPAKVIFAGVSVLLIVRGFLDGRRRF